MCQAYDAEATYIRRTEDREAWELGSLAAPLRTLAPSPSLAAPVSTTYSTASFVCNDYYVIDVGFSIVRMIEDEDALLVYGEKEDEFCEIHVLDDGKFYIVRD